MLLLVASCWFLYPLLSAIFEDNNFHIFFLYIQPTIYFVSYVSYLVRVGTKCVKEYLRSSAWCITSYFCGTKELVARSSLSLLFNKSNKIHSAAWWISSTSLKAHILPYPCLHSKYRRPFTTPSFTPCSSSTVSTPT